MSIPSSRLRLILISLLSLLASHASAVATNTTLNINVSVTVTSTVRIEWDAAALNSDGNAPSTSTTAATWAAGSLEAGASAVDTTGTNSDFIIVNSGTCRVDVVGKVASVSGLTYVGTGTPGLDQFKLSASNNAGSSWVDLPADPSTAAVRSDLAVSGTATIDLRLTLPSSISSASTPTTATVVIIAAPG